METTSKAKDALLTESGASDVNVERQLSRQEELLHDSIDELENLQETAKQRANDMFELLDLDELLKDPKRYMSHFGQAFAATHVKTTIEEASRAGRYHGKRMTKNERKEKEEP